MLGATSESPTLSMDKAADQLAALLLEQLPQHQQQSQLQVVDKPKPKGGHFCPERGCGKQFNRKYTLVEHMKTHTGEKPHVCPVRSCKKRFSTSGNLSRHKRLHGVIEPLECPVEGCYCTFPSDNKLEKHMKFHLGSPVHVCTVGTCGKTFSTTGNLNRHVKQHHPEATLPLPPPRGKRIMPPAQPQYLPQDRLVYQEPTPPLSLAMPTHPSTTVMMPPIAPQFPANWMEVPANAPLPHVMQVHTPTGFSGRTANIGDVLSAVFDDVEYASAPKMIESPVTPMGQLLPTQSQLGRVNLFEDMINFHVANNIQL